MIIDDVTFSYRRHHEVLHGVTVELAPGRTVLLGPNGAGKSTLLSLGSGLRRPTSGRIGLSRVAGAQCSTLIYAGRA